MKKIGRLLALLSLVALITHLLTPIASAHPLGNFTINHYAGLHVTREIIAIDYVLDMAEIPTFQEIAAFDANKNGQADPTEAAGYHPAQCEVVRAGLSLRLNGRPASLNLISSAVEFPPGAGGLPTLRLTCGFQAPVKVAADSVQVAFENKVYAQRLGWREIVVSGDGVALAGDLAGMSHSISQRLTAYPNDLLTSPLDQRQVSFELTPAVGTAQHPGGHLRGPVQATVLAAQPGQPLVDRNDEFTKLITLQNLTWPTILLALAGAFVWGAAHALTPGHGKTIVAAYLVGSRGTVRQAIFLGLTTTVTHTAGVFILGFLTLFASRFILPEKLYPWLGVISGALVVWIGLSLFRGRLFGMIGGAGRPDLPDHDHDDPGEYGLYHSHGGGPAHTHLPPGRDGAVTWRSLFALGVSGGLIPCPSALIVMLSAIALQRVGFGLVLIVAFSLGLAGVLTAIGVVWVQARRLFELAPKHSSLLQRIPGRGRLLQALPAASALFITIVGVGITWQALIQTGALAL